MKKLKVKERTRDILITKYTAAFNREVANKPTFYKYYLFFKSLNVTISRDIDFFNNEKAIIKVKCESINNVYEHNFDSDLSGLLAACDYVDQVRIEEAKQLICGNI